MEINTFYSFVSLLMFWFNGHQTEEVISSYSHKTKTLQ